MTAAQQAAEFSFEPVFAFVQARMPGLLRREHMTAIGWRKAGELVAGVVFENITRYNAWIHIAAVDGGHWLVRKALRYVFGYAFVVCGVQRLSATVEASNSASRRFVEHLGFVREAVLSGAAEDGGDVLIYVLWAKECRYVSLASD
jgi:RimJ/RimL family protein N-acetyltransferase